MLAEHRLLAIPETRYLTVTAGKNRNDSFTAFDRLSSF
jgi:hypothetical protein